MFEETSEEEEQKGEEDRGADEEVEEEYVCSMLKANEGKEKNVKGRLMKDLAEILEVVNKEWSQVADIICTIKELDTEKVKKTSVSCFSYSLE